MVVGRRIVFDRLSVNYHITGDEFSPFYHSEGCQTLAAPAAYHCRRNHLDTANGEWTNPVGFGPGFCVNPKSGFFGRA
jgi:hypothetical protein